MANITVLQMPGAGHGGEIETLREAGHAVVVVEPRWPECRDALGDMHPALVVVDGSHQPLHGRKVAAWMATQSRFRTVPFLFLDVPDRDMARVKKEVVRAQFGSWSSIVGASDRLAKRN
jgi:hypothetical protein